MSKPAHTIEIGRLVLTDLGLTPERAEHVRGLVEVELRRLLTREGFTDDFADGEVPRLKAPTMHVAELQNDHHLANGLAQSIAQSIPRVQ